MSVQSVLRRLLPFTSAGLALALLYVAWTFFSRWSDNRRIERFSQSEKAKADAKIVEMYGSGKLKILNFYATPGLVFRGKKGLICYGVANAVAVRIEPGIEPVKPSISRCVEISPSETTRYTLTAEDSEGHSATATFVLRVQ